MGMRRIAFVLGLLALLGVVVAGCGSSESSSSSASATTGSEAESSSSTVASSESEPVSIVLSNNFMGNQWRPQMVNIAKYVATSPKYSGKVDFSVKLSEPTPASQIASLQSIIREKPDAIIIDAASPTALNPTIEQACDAGITVVSFDQTVTADCAPKISEDYKAAAKAELSWMASQLPGEKGKVLMDKGLAGVQLSQEMVEAWEEEIGSAYPGIEVVGTYESEFTEAVEQQQVSDQLSQQSDVDGVLSQVSCAAVISAFKKAGRDLVPVGCNAYNGSQIACVEDKVPCFIYPSPAYIGGIAVERAYEAVAEGKELPEFENIGKAYMVSPEGESEFKVGEGEEIEPLKPGKNYYPGGSPALSTPVTYGEWNITPAIALGN